MYINLTIRAHPDSGDKRGNWTYIRAINNRKEKRLCEVRTERGKRLTDRLKNLPAASLASYEMSSDEISNV